MRKNTFRRWIVLPACLAWLGPAAALHAATEVELRMLTFEFPSGVSSVASTAALEALPNRITEIGAGEDFTLELWVSDVGNTQTGITGFFADLNFDPLKLRTTALTHSVPFTFLSEGTFDNDLGRVINFGGNDASLTGQAVSPAWSRIGHVTMQRIGAGTATIAPSIGLAGVGVLGPNQPSDSQIQLGGAIIGDTGSGGDCNGNGIADSVDIADGASLDCNTNDTPDDCEFPGCERLTAGDLTCDGAVDGRDIAPFVRFVTEAGYTCQADMDQDGDVDGVPAAGDPVTGDVALFVEALLTP